MRSYFLFSIAIASILSGCVVPVSGEKNSVNRKIQTGDVSFIQAGTTTRMEVRQKLGTNCISLPVGKALGYTWESGMRMRKWYFIPMTKESGSEDAGGWKAFFIAFENDVVAAHEFKNLSTKLSAYEQLDVWNAQVRK